MIRFECGPFGINLIEALDKWGIDILPDLVEEQRKDHQRQIAVYYDGREPSDLVGDGRSESQART